MPVNVVNARFPMPVIVGAPRSGTTLLRFMLDSHPAVAIPPETGFLVPVAQAGAVSPTSLHDIVTTYHPNFPGWSDFGLEAEVYRERLHRLESFSAAEGVREFYRMYAEKHGKSRYGDKTPLYCQHMTAIEQLLPEAHFIHIIRDGRDVALSLRKVWFAPGRDIPTLASYWAEMVRSTRAASPLLSHYLEVRYEDLIGRTESVLKSVCDFIELDFDPLMLRYW